MTISKIKKAVIKGVERRTDKFNTATFPQKAKDLTPEQEAVWDILYGESSGLSEVHETTRDELISHLSVIAGIQLHKRSAVTEVTPPPFSMFVLKEQYGVYPNNYPLLSSKISGAWTETGTGDGGEIRPRVAKMRPVTVDEASRFWKRFPDAKISKLWGAIDFPDTDALRTAIIESVKTITHKFELENLTYSFPTGITEKGKAILKTKVVMEMSSVMLDVLAIILDDPALSQKSVDAEYRAKPASIMSFPDFCSVVILEVSNGCSYPKDMPIVKADIPFNDIFFHPESIIGNHAPKDTRTFRVSTDDEIEKHFREMPEDNLYLYINALNEDVINQLL